MTLVYPIQATFTRGELSPKLHGRTDLDHYRMGLVEGKNVLVSKFGGLRRRPGSIFSAPVKGSCVVKPFDFAEDQSYAIELGNLYARFHTEQGRVELSTLVVTGATRANPCVLTVVAHGLATGDPIALFDFAGMVDLNNRDAVVTVLTANTISIGIDSSNFLAYTSGGGIAKIYEIVTTLSENDVDALQITQSEDTVYLAHASYWPKRLVRSGETSWVFEDIPFEDGPYLTENLTSTYLTLADRGSSVPKMTGLTTPSGTASETGGGGDAYQAFDLNQSTLATPTNASGFIQYLFPGGTTKVCDKYWIAANNDAHPEDVPTGWQFQGYDGTNWITLDERSGESGWGSGEKRFFEFSNTVAWQGYRYSYVGGGGPDAVGSSIAELGINQAGDDQTAFNCTASAITGINGGTGFQSTDVGRTIRIVGSDGQARWLKITSWTSTTVVKVKMYGHCLPDSTTPKIVRWSLSAFSVLDGYPRSVGFVGDRLSFAGSATMPRTVWASKVADYVSHGRSQPLVADDGFPATMKGGKLSRISFVAGEDALLIGTAGALRDLTPANPNEAFSALNVDSKGEASVGSAPIQPAQLDKVLVFVDRFKTRLHEASYDLNAAGYQAPELTILNEHLYAKGVADISYQRNPFNIIWAGLEDGRLAALTYEKAQQVVGATPQVIAGGDADVDDKGLVESVAVTPGQYGDTVWLVVRRIINGAAYRSLERLDAPFEADDAVETAVFFDMALTYNGTATNTVSGFTHLIGESVGILADGVDLGDATINVHGILTLPNAITASTITAGKRAPWRVETLRVATSGNADGSSLGRNVRVNEVLVDLMSSAGIDAGTNSLTETLSLRTLDDAPLDDETLKTGTFRIVAEDSWRNGGVAVIEGDRGYPVYIRALILAVEGEP